MPKSRRTQTRKSAKKSAAAASRTKVVWGSLMASMTAVGGLLWVLQGGPVPRADGLALPAMVAAAGPTSIETIFKTTRAEITPGRWQAIVIHHSGSAYGSPSTIAAQHKSMNLDGLGFHFLIGNGSGMGDGNVHVGYRWLEQVAGAHVAGKNGDWYNRNSIGICLVGDFSRQPPSERQMWRLSQLVSALADELKIPADHIYLHSDVAQTNDPGAFFPEAAFRAQLAGSH